MGKDILIIDDSQVTREALWEILKNDFKVFFASTGWEGMKMISKEIGLIFLDIVLPDINGLELLKQIKKEYPSIPVIILTGYGTEESCINAFRIGARDYIKKPFGSEEILQKVKMLMSNVTPQGRQHISLSFRNNGYNRNLKNIPAHILNGIMNVTDYIDKNPSMFLSLSEACRMAGTNKTYFCHYFKDITGQSLKDFLHNMKVKIAKELLKNRDLSITDIAHLLGYNDSNYFSSTFKKITGNYPSHLRTLLTFKQS